MRKTFANCASQEPINRDNNDGAGRSDQDHLQELVWLEDDDAELDENDRESVGDLGNELDDVEDIDAILHAFCARPPTRLNWMMHRAVECMRTLRSMKSAPCSPWPDDRISEEQWRALADEALGLIGKAVGAELKTQEVVRKTAIEERGGLQCYLDTSIGMGLFRRSFEKEREAWERAYWRRGFDESFGKRLWSGPGGWRAAFEPRYVVETSRPRDQSGKQARDSKP